ncbi:uncharacterized protein [Notamacropus eugenii]|uniref:uncharacterized protein isoform X2 n=1 Tax=Notamacropus eugenii TaxID=9315 RepID=UPI003B67F860
MGGGFVIHIQLSPSSCSLEIREVRRLEVVQKQSSVNQLDLEDKMPFFRRSVLKTFWCCRLTSQVENIFPSQSVELQCLPDEVKPDFETTSLSEGSSESKSASESSSSCRSGCLGSSASTPTLDLTKEPEEEERKSTVADNPEPLPDDSNVSTPSDIGEPHPPFPVIRSSLNAPVLQLLETNGPSQLVLRQDSLQASNPTSWLSKCTRTLAKKMAACFHVQVAKLEGEIPMRPLEEMEEDEENTMLPEEQSHSTEDVPGVPNIVALEEPPSQTQEVSEIAPDHLQKQIPEQSDKDNLRKSFGMFHNRESQDLLVTRSRSMSFP